MLPECRRNALLFTGTAAVAALVGGTALLLASSPLQGAALAGIVGGASALAFVVAWRRSAFDLDAELFAGGALALYTQADVALRSFRWPQVVYGLLGLLMLLQAGNNSLRSREWRHHWIVGVTLGETIGYLAPAATGVLLASRGVEGWTLVGAISLAGLAEGAILGLAQARSFPFTVNARRYALLTSAAAGLAWLSITTIVTLAPTLPPATTILLGAPLGALALFSIGGAQWIELRRHSTLGSRAWTWIGWTALAWALALPLSFAAGPLVDDGTPIATHLLLWGSAGALMAYVFALVTWQGVRRMERG